MVYHNIPIEVALRGVEQFAKDVQRREKDQRGEPRDNETRHGKNNKYFICKKTVDEL